MDLVPQVLLLPVAVFVPPVVPPPVPAPGGGPGALLLWLLGFRLGQGHEAVHEGEDVVAGGGTRQHT